MTPALGLVTTSEPPGSGRRYFRESTFRHAFYHRTIAR